MSGIQQDNFEYVAGDITKLLAGIYAERGSSFGVGENDTVLAVPAWETQGRDWLFCDGRGTGLRRVLGGSYTSLGVVLFFGVPSLPGADNRVWIWQGRASDNSDLITLTLKTDGVIEVRNNAGTVVAQTADPVITAGVQHKIQFQFTTGSPTGEIEIRVDNIVVLTASGLVMGGTITQWFIGSNDSAFGPYGVSYYKSYAIYSLTGTYNNDWPLVTGVITLYPSADTAADTLTPRPRQKIEDGVLNVPGAGSLLDCDTSNQYRINGDFTLEAWVRWTTLQDATVTQTLWGLWNELDNQRSYRLTYVYDGISAGYLAWQVSTTGIDVIDVDDIAFTPQIGVWYNIAICRTGGNLYWFIDGQQVGLVAPDAYTYHHVFSNAKFTIGGLISGTGTTVQANTSIDGMFDAFRFTEGVARYTSNYTPTEVPYPTSSPADPYWNDVELMMGFDTGIANESSHAHTNTARGSAAQLVPADGGAAYKVIALEPYDDRYLEAPFASADGILTFTGQPVLGNTVTLGAETYLFTSLTPVNPYDVFIGATLSETILNLVNAITNGPGEGTTYGPGTPANSDAYAQIGPEIGVQMTATALSPGVAGNAIASSVSGAFGYWTGSFLSGGADIPGYSEYEIDNPSIDVTGVRWISIMNRSYVEGGTGNLQLSLVTSGVPEPGLNNLMTTTPTYYTDTYEIDPSTGVQVTLATLNNSVVRVQRTT